MKGTDDISLTNRQKEAVEHEGNVVVSAGPGSGKTRTLVARASWALNHVSPFRGVACLTYTNDAAREIATRIARSGVRDRRRVTSSTLHSFCLNQILRPYGPILNEWVPTQPGQIIDDTTCESLLQKCLDNVGVNEKASWRSPTITKIRRAIACNERLESFDSREVDAAIEFERLLISNRVIDFEAMVFRALKLVEEHARLRDILTSRFPHILVDEYQDMGGPLHQLVLQLYEQAGSVLFAVGDTDQTMFAFAGADARYFEQLIARKTEFRHVELDTNFRSGHDIVAVADALLAPTRPRQAAIDATAGAVEFHHLKGDFDAHAVETVAAVRRYGRGTPLDGIAILYPQKGYLLDRIIARLNESGVPFIHERSELLPAGELSGFIQRVASLAVAMFVANSGGYGPGFLKEQRISSLRTLINYYERLRRDSVRPRFASRFEAGRRIGAITDYNLGNSPQRDALEWVTAVANVLDLDEIADNHPERTNRNALAQIEKAVQNHGMALQDLASQVTAPGKVILTTYHSSKGREFDSVILPGLVNGLIPKDVKDGGRWRFPNETELLEQKRSFYVALTRPEHRLCLISGRVYQPNKDHAWDKGPSQFLVELYRRYENRG